MNSIEIQYWRFIEDKLVQKKTFSTRSSITIDNYISKLNCDAENMLIDINIYRNEHLYKTLHWPTAIYAKFDKYIIFEYLECHYNNPKYKLNYDTENEKIFEDEPFYKVHMDDTIVIKIEFLGQTTLRNKLKEKFKSIFLTSNPNS